jgi:hypothetical protein
VACEQVPPLVWQEDTAWIWPVVGSYPAAALVAHPPPEEPPPEQSAWALPVCAPSGEDTDAAECAPKLVVQFAAPEQPAEEVAYPGPAAACAATLTPPPPGPEPPPDPDAAAWAVLDP